MRTVFALATGIVLGTAAALWIAARGERQADPVEAGSIDTQSAPTVSAVAQSAPSMSEEAPE